MSIVCTICQEFLSELPQTLVNDDNELYVIALKCGHLFHRQCIEEWFVKKGGSANSGSCPCCKVMVSTDEGLRIYPSGDEDSSDIVTKLKSLKVLERENGHLKQEISQVNMLLEDTGCQLENERVEHEILKYEFTRLESEMLALREEHNRVKTEKENVDSGKEAFEEEIGTLKSTLERERQEFSTKIADLSNNTQSVQDKEDKACQTDCRDAAILQARLVSYKSCMLHMQSEIKLLEHEYEKVSNLQPVPEEFQCYIHEQNELAEKKKQVEKPFSDIININLSDESLEPDDSGDSMSMDG